jgi:hypothetical protein
MRLEYFNDETASVFMPLVIPHEVLETIGGEIYNQPTNCGWCMGWQE